MRWLYAYLAITALALAGVATYSGWRRGQGKWLDNEDESMAVILVFSWPLMAPVGLFILAVYGFWCLMQLPGKALGARSLRHRTPPDTEQGSDRG